MEEKYYDGNLIIRQFSWCETKTIESRELYEYVSSILPCYIKFYLFFTLNYSFPMSFSVKHFGLWKNLIKKYDIKVDTFKEKNIELRNHGAIYGIARGQPTEDLYKLLLDSYCNSWILFSDIEYDLEFLMENFVEKSDRDLKICYDKIVDCLCEKGNKIVLFIKGSGEASLYLIELNQGMVL